MPNVFNFGIGLNVVDEATPKIQGVIRDLSSIESKLLEINKITGGVSTIMPEIDTSKLDKSIDQFAKQQATTKDIIVGASVESSVSELPKPDITDFAADSKQIVMSLSNISDMMKVVVGYLLISKNIGFEINKNGKETDVIFKSLGDSFKTNNRELLETESRVKGIAVESNKIKASGAGKGAVGAILDPVKGIIDTVKTGINIATSLISELEHVTVRQIASMGGARVEAKKFQHDILAVSNRTGIAWEEVAKLGLQLNKTGIAFDSFTKKDQDALVHMSTTFGVGAEKTAAFAASARLLGRGTRDLINDVGAFQQKFKVPGLMEQLPEAAEAALMAQARFGKQVSGDASRTTIDISRMTAQYSRALGKTAVEAARAARESFMNFATEISGFEDVFLGLSDDFTPLQKALIQSGRNLEEVEALLAMGRDSPIEYAKAMRDLIDTQPDTNWGRRIEKQILAATPSAAVRLMITNTKALNQALSTGIEPRVKTAGEGQIELQKQQIVTIEALTAAMRTNAKDSADMASAVFNVTQELGKLQIQDQIRAGFDLARKPMQDMNSNLIEISRNLKVISEQFGTITNPFKEMNTAAAATAAAVGLIVLGLAGVKTGLAAAMLAGGPFFIAMAAAGATFALFVKEQERVQKQKRAKDIESSKKMREQLSLEEKSMLTAVEKGERPESFTARIAEKQELKAKLIPGAPGSREQALDYDLQIESFKRIREVVEAKRQQDQLINTLAGAIASAATPEARQGAIEASKKASIDFTKQAYPAAGHMRLEKITGQRVNIETILGEVAKLEEAKKVSAGLQSSARPFMSDTTGLYRDITADKAAMMRSLKSSVREGLVKESDFSPGKDKSFYAKDMIAVELARQTESIRRAYVSEAPQLPDGRAPMSDFTSALLIQIENLLIKLSKAMTETERSDIKKGISQATSILVGVKPGARDTFGNMLKELDIDVVSGSTRR